MNPDGFIGGAQALREQKSVLSRLGEIRVPTLILAGELDYLLPASRLMQRRILDSRFVLVKGTPHGTAAWRPEAFTTAVLDFLEAVDSGEPVAGEFEL